MYIKHDTKDLVCDTENKIPLSRDEASKIYEDNPKGSVFTWDSTNFRYKLYSSDIDWKLSCLIYHDNLFLIDNGVFSIDERYFCFWLTCDDDFNILLNIMNYNGFHYKIAISDMRSKLICSYGRKESDIITWLPNIFHELSSEEKRKVLLGDKLSIQGGTDICS